MTLPIDANPAVHAALRGLLEALKARGYHFVTPTPATHRRVLDHRRGDCARDLRDVFGWSLPFEPAIMPADIFEPLARAGLIDQADGLHRARIRVSALAEDLLVHSAFPTVGAAVFFGPDTYRFDRFIRSRLSSGPAPRRLIDIGSGSGAGVLSVGRAAAVAEVIATDINPQALQMARVNLEAAGIEAQFRQGSGLEGVEGPADLIIDNPPFIADADKRTYRHGGERRGAQLSLDWSLAAARRLTPGGRFLLYTGSAIVGGVDDLKQTLQDALDLQTFSLDYQELDPDIFGEQLDEAGYADVERIAAIGAVITRASHPAMRRPE